MNYTLRIIKSIGLIYTVFSFLLAANAFGGYEDTIERSFDVGSGGILSIESDLGSIEITTNSDNKVNVEILLEVDTRNEEKAQKVIDKFELEFDHDGNDVRIFGEYENTKGWNFWGSRGNKLRVKFIISVPEQYDVDLETGGGGITIDGLKGDVVCKTSGGGLTFEGIDGTIRGRTSGGSIEIIRCKGETDVETSGGGITIDKAEGEIYANTSGGGIDIEEIKGKIEASTSGGGITAYISGQPEGDCSLTTSGGGIKVYLEENVKLDVNARTSGGRVKSDFFEYTGKRHNKSSWRGEINGGGPELYLRTSAGNIYIEEI